MSNEVILELKDLHTYFTTRRGVVKAVNGVSYEVEAGKTLGIVGESGCGKSTAGRAILRLVEPTGGQVFFEGEDIVSLSESQMYGKRKDMQIIFQDPFSSLNPRKTVSEAISEPLSINKIITDKKKRSEKVLEVMSLVGLAKRLVNTYPHELDGGRRQRIGIARALALDPKFIVCDEPVSALDVSIQAQILNLMEDLQKEMGLTYLFISHDLGVIKHMSNNIAVMYLGKIVEMSDYKSIFVDPQHPYTKALLSAIPIPDVDIKRERIILEGDVPSPINPPPGCRFYGRCFARKDECKDIDPELTEISPGRFVACHLCKKQ